jgi:hypothetical protein
MSVELTQSILALHLVWSICVPIAIVETFTAAVYALAAGLVFWGNYTEERFLAAPAQLAGIGVVIVALVAVALTLRSRQPPRTSGAAPPARVVGGAALVATSSWWGPAVS